jgi:hypothetical protein
VADVQITVRLGRKTGDHERMFAGLEVVPDNFTDEVEGFAFRGGWLVGHGWSFRKKEETASIQEDSRRGKGKVDGAGDPGFRFEPLPVQ